MIRKFFTCQRNLVTFHCFTVYCQIFDVKTVTRLLVFLHHSNTDFGFQLHFCDTVSSLHLLTPIFTDRAKLCGRSWSIDTMETPNLAREEIASQASAMAHSLLECRENHLQVCKTIQYLCVCMIMLIKIR